jgi:hypothetical protein
MEKTTPTPRKAGGVKGAAVEAAVGEDIRRGMCQFF